MPRGTPRRIAIFGATSAIAAELARRYAQRGDRLYLFARNPAKLEKLLAELREIHGMAEVAGRAKAQAAVAGFGHGDLNELDANAQRVAAAIECLGGLDMALIAHGDLGDQLRSEQDIGEAENILCTNFRSPVSLILALANGFEAQGSGTLAVLSSVAGDRGRPHNYSYGAAKSAVSTYLEGVRSRLYPSGVRVCDLRLGPVDTPMTADHPKTPFFSQVAPVADRILRCVDRGVPVAYVPSWWRWIMWGVCRLPEPIFQRLKFLSGR